MFCKNCGREVEDNASFCPNCGASLESTYSKNYSNYEQPNQAALVGFIFSFLIPIVGLILGIVGASNAKKGRGRMGFAVAAIVISATTMIINWFFREALLNYLENLINSMETVTRCF